MARKKKETNAASHKAAGDYGLFAEGSKVGSTELVPISDSLKDNYMPYAMSVIVSRAIPEIDGFKPSQRKVLYTMYHMGLSKGARAKCADIVGQTMAFNPHGDQTIYETLVRMTRGNEALLNPWIDSKGNMGKVYSRDMSYAAYRYTEARLDKSCECIFSGLEENAVDFMDNYSATMQEPRLLPAAVPTILINANQGIAVGMASNICSFNFKEVCAATRALLEDPEADILSLMPAPDFSTAASILYDEAQMRAIYESGRGSFRMAAKARLLPGQSRIEILEIPYSTSIETIMEEVTRQAKAGKLRELLDMRDETDLSGLRITFDFKKNTDLEKALAKLYRLTPLTSSFACNFNILLGNKPHVLGVRQILQAWIAWREECLSRELRFQQQKLSDKLHLLRALEQILLDIDEAIRIIRRTEREEDVLPQLMAAFSIDEKQAEFVAEIRLRQLNREYLLKRTEEISSVEDQIAEITATLASKKRLDRRISRQLQTYAERYGRERKTTLIPLSELPTEESVEEVPDYNLRLFFTREGYLKKLPLTSLRSAGDLKLKVDDQIIQSFASRNSAEILFFSSKGNVYKYLARDLADQKPSELGEFTPNFLELEEAERILFMLPTVDFQGLLLLVFADGHAVKVELSQYATKQRRKKLLSGIYGGAELRALLPLEKEDQPGELLLTSSDDRLILLDMSLVPLKKTRHSQGVQLFRLKAQQEVLSVRLLNEEEAKQMAYYRVRSLPAAGRFRKETGPELQQLALDLSEAGSDAQES